MLADVFSLKQAKQSKCSCDALLDRSGGWLCLLDTEHSLQITFFLSFFILDYTPILGWEAKVTSYRAFLTPPEGVV